MDRGLSSAIGVGVLAMLTIAITISFLLIVPAASTNHPPTARLSMTADADDQRIALTHDGGDRLNVSELQIEVEVDGEPLRNQPPVPFFSAAGFRSGPTGPFNSASDNDWTAGETASFRIAGTNHPSVTPGVEITVRIIARGTVIFEETQSAR